MAAALALAPKAATRLFLDVERSVCGRSWRDRLDERATARALAIAQRHNVPELLARILAGRGVEVDEVEAFLDPTVRRLMPDPHTVTAMEQAAQRLADAMLRGEQVAIFGDYDVDGATASALLARFMRHRRRASRSCISRTGFSKAMAPTSRRSARSPRAARHCSSPSIAAPPASSRWPRRGGLAWMSSCSITIRPTSACRMRSWSIPTGSTICRGLAISPPSAWCSSTVVAVNRVLRTRGFWTEARPEPDLLGWLDIVALGTVADVVPLKGLNRAFVAKGLLALRRRDNVGLTALMDVARLTGPPEPFHLGFLLGPRINAGGRIGRADLGSLLLRTDDPVEAGRIAAELDRLNGERRAMEVAMLEEAQAEAQAALGIEEKGAVVVTAAANWHPGVVGLACGAAEGAFQSPGLCDCARARRHRHRLGPLDPRASISARPCAARSPRACCSRAAAMPWRRASP